MKRYILTLCSLMLFAGLHAQTVSVGGKSFSSIQEAINKARPGSVIEIRGIHQESLKLNARVTLSGGDPSEDKILGVGGSVITAVGKYGAQDLTIENLTIANGRATEGPGGGLMLKGVKGTVTLRNLIIENNTANKVGGGVMAAASTLVMENCWIRKNYSEAMGGGISFNSGNFADSEVTVRNCVISGNTSAGNGGGIFVNGNPKWGDEKTLNLTLENTLLTYNSSGSKGGAMFVKGAVHLPTNKTNITVSMNHLTAAYNRSTAEKGGVPGIGFFGGGGAEPRVSITNSLIVLNGEAGEADVHFGRTDMQAHAHNIYSKLLGANAVDLDMSTSQVIREASRIGLADQLTQVAGALPHLALQANSAAINKAGEDTALDTDMNGKKRSFPDIGAWEY